MDDKSIHEIFEVIPEIEFLRELKRLRELKDSGKKLTDDEFEETRVITLLETKIFKSFTDDELKIVVIPWLNAIYGKHIPEDIEQTDEYLALLYIRDKCNYDHKKYLPTCPRCKHNRLCRTDFDLNINNETSVSNFVQTAWDLYNIKKSQSLNTPGNFTGMFKIDTGNDVFNSYVSGYAENAYEFETCVNEYYRQFYDTTSELVEKTIRKITPMDLIIGNTIAEKR